jgi:TatA/E family protein of Tat protein translocase
LHRPVFSKAASAQNTMFGLGAGEILIILVIAFLLFGPKQLPEIGRQVGQAVKGFKETADDLKKTVEPEINLIQQEMKMVEQDFESSMKEAEEEINHATSGVERGAEESGLPKQA